MRVEPFLDTTVLVYAFSTGDRRSEHAKAVLARGGRASVQVANEFVDVSHRKLRWSWGQISACLDVVRALLGVPVPLTDETHRLAIDISRRHGFRLHDSLILSAASLAGCRTLLTEDLQEGQVIEGVTVRNPFAGA